MPRTEPWHSIDRIVRDEEKSTQIVMSEEVKKGKHFKKGMLNWIDQEDQKVPPELQGYR